MATTNETHARCPRCSKGMFSGNGSLLRCTNCGTISTVEDLCKAAYAMGRADPPIVKRVADALVSIPKGHKQVADGDTLAGDLYLVPLRLGARAVVGAWVECKPGEFIGPGVVVIRKQENVK